MTFAIYESIKMNTTTTTGMGTPKPEKEPIQTYHVPLVIPEAPEGTTHEEAIEHLRRAGHYLEAGQEIRAETEWPEDVRQQVDSDPNLRRPWADFTAKR
jgi:hypothetical protein